MSSGGSSGGGRPKFREMAPSDSEDSDSDSHSSESPESSSGSDDEKSSPAKRSVIGPMIPPELKNMSTNDTEKVEVSASPEVEEEEEGNYGPALPPSFAPDAPSVIGPAMPPGFKPGQSEDMEEDDPDVIGPVLPSGDQSQHSSSAAADFERRAQAMKNKLNNPGSEGPVQRETWMLELPEKMKAGMGLQARTFKTRDTSEVDAAWTETPADKERRLKEGRKRTHDEAYIPTQRDKEMEEQVEILNAKRQKSLYDLHQEKVHGSASKKDKKNKDKKKRKEKKAKEKKKEKKKKEKEKKKKEKEKDGKPERRPFDRDLDLKVNQFDDAMRKKYIKSAQGLGNNFGHSAKGKYL